MKDMRFKKNTKKILIISLLISIQLSMFVSVIDSNNTGNELIKSADTEPNDDANNANMLQEGMTYGSVNSTDEWDWYSIYCEVDDNLVIDYTVIHTDLYLYPLFSIYNPSGGIDEVYAGDGVHYNYIIWEEGWWNISIQNRDALFQTNYSIDAFHSSYSDVPSTPTLTEITPSPDKDGTMHLSWSASDVAEYYHVFRSTSPIVDAASLVPIANISTTEYVDEHLGSGTYYYAVNGGWHGINSTLSKNEIVVVDLEIPLDEYTIMDHAYMDFLDTAPTNETFYILQDPMHLKFAFPFYDQLFSTLYVSEEGWISFENSNPTETDPDVFPNDNSAFNFSIAPFLTPNYDVAMNLPLTNETDYWGITWENADSEFGGYNDFSVILFRTGEIMFEYHEVDLSEYTPDQYHVGINYGDGVTGLELEQEGSMLYQESLVLLPSNERAPLPVKLNDPTNNPDLDGLITLDWEPLLLDSENYFLFRSDAEITEFNVDTLTPVYEGSALLFQDNIDIDGTYFYAVIAQNGTLNSTLSNNIEVDVLRQIPSEPILDIFDPSTTTTPTVHLNWSIVQDTTAYYVYRNTSLITDISSLTPIAHVTTHNFTESIYVNGEYFYCIVAENEWGNSSISNCESITVNVAVPDTPVLNSFILDYSHTGNISISWEAANNALFYYIYRETSEILTTTGLNPIATITELEFYEKLDIDGEYFYAVVASNIVFNSSVSSNVSITVELLEMYDYSTDTAFSWVDTSAGETINLHDDDNTNRLLPFDFPFYGEIFDTIYIDANGFLCFTPISGDHYTEVDFPIISATYSYCIAAFWADIVPNDDISILSTPDYWVISWSNVIKWSVASTEYLGSFQILLFENGDIKFQYKDIASIVGGYTTGINLGDGELGFSYEEITDSTEELAIVISHDLDRIPDQPEFSAYPSQPTFESAIPLQWSPSPLADNYYLYRTLSEITTLAELSGETPIYSGPNLEFTDSLIDSGIYYYTIIAGNELGNSSVSSCLEVEANLLPPASPTLLTIEDPIDTEAQIKVTWSEVDGAQTYYVIMENETITSNTPNKIGFETTELEYEIDVTANREYFVVVIASNIHGNSTISNCLSIEFTSIVDPHEENFPPTVTHPEDVVLELWQLPYAINWTISDATVSTGVYHILVNDTLNVTGNWADQSVISFEITDFPIGNYSITIEVEDGENSAVIDSVFLSIIANTSTTTDPTGSTEPEDPTDIPLGVILGSLGGSIVILVGGLLIRRKKLGKS